MPLGSFFGDLSLGSTLSISSVLPFIIFNDEGARHRKDIWQIRLRGFVSLLSLQLLSCRTISYPPDHSPSSILELYNIIQAERGKYVIHRNPIAVHVHQLDPLNFASQPLCQVCLVNHPAMRESERCFGLAASAASAAVAALDVPLRKDMPTLEKLPRIEKGVLKEVAPAHF